MFVDFFFVFFFQSCYNDVILAVKILVLKKPNHSIHPLGQRDHIYLKFCLEDPLTAMATKCIQVQDPLAEKTVSGTSMLQ